MNKPNSNVLSSKYQNLKDDELLFKTAQAAMNEKQTMLALIEYLVEVDSRRLYAAKAHSSLFDYLVRELKFSEPAAADRVNTVRLIREVPHVKDLLDDGRLLLTNASQIQRHIKTEERASKTRNGKIERIDISEKVTLTEACLDQSKREVEKTLLKHQSESARILTHEKVRLISGERTELKFSINETTFEKLETIKQLIDEKSLETIFDCAIDLFLAKESKKRGFIVRRNPSVTPTSNNH